MVYLDYSATTPVDPLVLDTYVRVSNDFIGNANSLHYLGFRSHKLMDEAVGRVASFVHAKSSEVIFTSGASESNNMALIGTSFAYPCRNKIIVTTLLEHSSILDSCSYLKKLGFEIMYLRLDNDGHVDITNLKELLALNPMIVSIGYVNSEVGIVQDIKLIGSIIKSYPLTLFHVDGTQAISKVPLFLDDVDLFSFSAHKFFGPKGIGCLIKKEKVMMEPLIHGGKSQSFYRSGTPPLPLMVSMAKALSLVMPNMLDNYNKVLSLNNYLRSKLILEKDIIINSKDHDSPYILNISIIGIKPEVLVHALDEYEIYISSKTACSSDDVSLALLTLFNDKKLASSSLRISLSFKTTKEELDYFYEKLIFIKNSLISLKGGN